MIDLMAMFMPILSALLRGVVSIWQPRRELSPRLQLEMRILLGRWLGIAIVGLALFFHVWPSAPTVPGYAILTIALAYTMVLRWLIGRGHRAVENGTLPTTGDVLLCASMLPIVGGFAFPFYSILYLVMISAGIRLGFKRGMLLALTIAVLDAATNVFYGTLLAQPGYGLRTGVLLAIVPITSFLHDQAKKTEAALAERLRQSEVLNRTLEHQAMHDQLTGLANRTNLLRQLEATVAAARQDSRGPALLVVGLDRIDEVNDTLGHVHGDRLLQHIAARLRSTFADEGLVACLGSDQFAVLLAHADHLDAERAAQALLRTFEETFTVANCAINVGASIGVALHPEHGSDSDQLLRRADVAMSVARRTLSGVAFYSADEDRHSADRLALVPELKRAIECDELQLWYQPKLALNSSRCVGLEVLVRWQHPRRGVVPPDQFIPIAEQTGMIKHVSRWVLNASLRQQRQWKDLGLTLPIAVNLSMHDLQNPRLLDELAELLARWQVQPGDLLVEITESSLMLDPVRAFETVTGLHTLGVGTAIDDFGTGYSSLGYLKRLPVDELKIDKSFVQHLATDEDDLAIVRSTIRLGHDLGLSVTAEGVEDASAFSLLRELGCDVAQGYYVGRPRPADKVIEELRPRRARAATPSLS